jgi:hypothetical protein
MTRNVLVQNRAKVSHGKRCRSVRETFLRRCRGRGGRRHPSQPTRAPPSCRLAPWKLLPVWSASSTLLCFYFRKNEAWGLLVRRW